MICCKILCITLINIVCLFFNEISIDSKFDALNKFNKVFKKLEVVKKKSNQRNKAKNLYDEPINACKAEYNLTFKSKKKDWG